MNIVFLQIVTNNKYNNTTNDLFNNALNVLYGHCDYCYNKNSSLMNINFRSMHEPGPRSTGLHWSLGSRLLTPPFL